MAVGEDVYCTLLMGDSYLPGAAVLAHSLRDAGTHKNLACLIVQDTLRDTTITELRSLYNYVIPIDRIGNPNPANLYLMNRPDLLYAFTKINLWRLTEFRKIVYLDADVVALRAPDELFETKEVFAAAPDVGWPDIFNSGVMVLAPNMGDFWALKTLAAAGDSFDGADQGLLNQYFEHKPWKRLSFSYNCTPSANYQYEPAYRYFKRDISLVHFIGAGKPWQQDRHIKGAPGAFHELLSRWWSVYDRHFKVAAHDYITSGIREYRPQTVQREVKQPDQPQEQTYYATGYPVKSTNPAPPPQPAPPAEARATGTDAPFTEDYHEGEAIGQGHVEPTPTQEQRRFSAPHMEWDATRSAPPAESKPEAVNFPTQIYEFNTDPAQFKPPASYPEPPKDMWFEVPKEPPRKVEKPKPIFPWEERQAPKPTRRFIEDEAPPLAQPPELDIESTGLDEFEVTNDDYPEPVTPRMHIPESAPWQDFGGVNKNAWDEISGIENYVRQLTAFQKNRGQVQVLHPPPGARETLLVEASITSPTAELEPAELLEQVQKRRESLILTDFPTAVERPSLPVTPAPRRRSTFWGEERDAEGELPAAEGVPNQTDWDPNAQLEQLRRTSLIGPDDLKIPDKKAHPVRDMPQHSLPTIAEQTTSNRTAFSTSKSSHGVSHLQAQHHTQHTSETNSHHSTLAAAASDHAEKQAAKAPRFTEPNFGSDGASSSTSSTGDSLLSPSSRPEGLGLLSSPNSQHDGSGLLGPKDTTESTTAA